MHNCYRHCSFRTNQLSGNPYNCDCSACPIRADNFYQPVASDHTLTKEELRPKGKASMEEIKFGTWKHLECGTMCTNCNRVFDSDFEIPRHTCESLPRCPNCGARMVEATKI